jgi:hypothetical protein
MTSANRGQQNKQNESVQVECPYCRNTISSVAEKCYHCEAIIDRQTMERLISARYGRQDGYNAQARRESPYNANTHEMETAARVFKIWHGSEPQQQSKQAPQEEDPTTAWLTSIGALNEEVEVTEETFALLSRVYQRYLFIENSIKEPHEHLLHLQKKKDKAQIAKQGYTNLCKSTTPSTEVAKKRLKDVDKILAGIDKEIAETQKSIEERKLEMNELENRARLVVLDSLVGIDTVEFDDRPKIVKSGEEKTDEPVCGICLGSVIKENDIVRCRCGLAFHSQCAKSVGECPKCSMAIKK